MSKRVLFKLESDVNDFVKDYLSSLGLKKLVDYNEESGMSEYMKDALRGSAKTKNKSNFGKPDFHIEKYRVPIVIEDKLGIKHLVAENKSGQQNARSTMVLLHHNSLIPNLNRARHDINGEGIPPPAAAGLRLLFLRGGLL